MADLIALVISPSILVWIAFIWLLGIFLKKCTPFPNGLITLVLILTGGIIGLIQGITHPNFEVVAYTAQGIVLGLLAVGSYDIFHGFLKSLNKDSEGEITMKKSKTSEFFKSLTSLWLSMAVVAFSVLCTVIASIVISGWKGFGGILDAASVAILISSFVLTINDIAFKLGGKKYLLCWQYWVLTALIVLTDLLFAFTWKSTTFPEMFIELALTFGSGIGTIIFYKLCYTPAEDEKLEEINKVLSIYMKNHNIPESASSLLFNPNKEELKEIVDSLKPVKENKKTKACKEVK